MQHNDIGDMYDLAEHRLKVAEEDFETAFLKRFGKRIGQAEQVRHNSDYDDFYIVTKTETVKQLETAEMLLNAVKEYIKKKSLI